MKTKFFDIAIKENRPVCYYLFHNYGINNDCKYFVETGTYLGGSVQFAIELGFEKVFSCEMMKERYDFCRSKFSNNINVNLWHGKSQDCFFDIMQNVTKKSCFWLDSHGEGGGIPTFFELDLIEKNMIKDHTIIIDDIPIYFQDNRKQLEDKILNINSNYNLKYFKSIENYDEYVLVASI